MDRSRVVAAAALSATAGLCLSFSASAQVITRDGQLVYPQGQSISRALTPVEREWLRTHPISAGADAVTAPPTGPVHCAAEFEPQEGIIIGWEGSSGQNAILAEMAKRVTVDAASKVYVICDSAAIQTSATISLTNAGCNMANVTFIVIGPSRSLDSIWMCDYGPRFIYEGNCRAVIDHKYNRPRPNDDIFPDYWAQTYKKQAFYQLGANGNQLIHGGGNFHLDGGNNRGFATRLVVNENNPPSTAYSYPEPLIGTTWLNYQNLNMTFLDPFPTSVDSTQHIDMWMQMVDNNKVVISDWPNNVGSTQDIICDNTAALLASQGYTVYRVPAYSVSGVHYTFTNTVFVNNIILIPTYTSGVPSAAATSAAAVATFQSALPPGKTAIGINCQNIIGSAGAIHCIVRIIPAHKGLPGPGGGLAPTAYLKAPNGGQSYTPGQNVTISWISDDDLVVSSVDLLLSTDGGATYPTTIAAAQAPIGSYNWTVPNINTTTARVRVVARDAVSNTGSDDSDADFTILGQCYANCDGSSTAPILNVNDFICFNNLFAAGSSIANCDGSTTAPVLNVNDFSCFLNAYAVGCS